MLTKLGFTKHADIGDDIKKNYRYGKYLFLHKKNIISPMEQLGLPLSQALKHDMSKLRPSEWGPYAEWQAGPTGRIGTNDPETFHTWRRAVERHYRRNPHHYRKWNHPEDVGRKYKMEALADWYSVNKSKYRLKGYKGFPDFRHWYAQRYYNLPLDPQVRIMVDSKLNVYPAAYREFTENLKAKQDARRRQI
jgi:hypothetical protein